MLSSKIPGYFLFGLLLTAFGVLAHEESAEEAADEKVDYEATTASDVTIPVEELSLLVKPLTAGELEVEATAWMKLLQAKTRETSLAELAIKQKNKSIEKAEEVQDALAETQELLEEVGEASLAAGETGDLESMEEVSELADEAQKSVEESVASIEQAIETTKEVAKNSEVREALDTARAARAVELSDQAQDAREATRELSDTADKAVMAAEDGRSQEAAELVGDTVKAAKEAAQALQSTSETIDEAVAENGDVTQVAQTAQLNETAQLAAAVADRELADKEKILSSVTELRNQRTAITDRLNVVLDELSSKRGMTAEGIEHEFIVPFRLYAEAVNGIKVDVTDTHSAVSNIIGWLRSDLGGVRVARNLGYFLLSVASFWVLGWILGRVVDRALRLTKITLELMRSVIVRSVRRIMVVVGIIIGLSAMDINIGPILALLGAAGFVVAFALQDTLSNFASGIMIMIYRPFDVGDLISVGGVTGEARSMNLVSTTIATRDNQLLIVPNNTIWGNIITNITGSEIRRIDMVFRIGYDDEISVALEIMEAVLKEHPLILDEPEPTIAVGELGPVSVNFVCRPWANTGDYWTVYREITRNVKERFQQAGLVPPYLKDNVSTVQSLPATSGQEPAFPVSDPG